MTTSFDTEEEEALAFLDDSRGGWRGTAAQYGGGLAQAGEQLVLEAGRRLRRGADALTALLGFETRGVRRGGRAGCAGLVDVGVRRAGGAERRGTAGRERTSSRFRAT